VCVCVCVCVRARARACVGFHVYHTESHGAYCAILTNI